MSTRIPLELLTHTQKIKRVYKKFLRNIESWENLRANIRLRCVEARPDFEKILNEKDMIKSKQMLKEKEHELFINQHYQPKKFPTSPGGVCYERYAIVPDWVLDYWHPLEKAQYPDFFARRELRKKQYLEMWEKQYGPSTKEGGSH